MTGLSDLRRPVGFVATTAPEAALRFYRDQLGLDLVEQSPFALVFDDAGQMLRVQIVQALSPAGHTVHGWEVEDIDVQIDALIAQGVEMARFSGLVLDARGVWQTPDGARIAWFCDPDGNILSLTQA